MSAEQLFDTTALSFGPRFLRDYVGHIMTDPRIAIVELVANAYDAGASLVEIDWPLTADAEFAVSDDGTGMTPQEFDRRWRTLSYSRVAEQGHLVEFPPGTEAHTRTAFGQNGKGRFAPFCFSDAYTVETQRAGQRLVARVSISGIHGEPFTLQVLERNEANGNGTVIRGTLKKEPLPVSAISDAIGSKFLVDPTFHIRVNGVPLQLLDLKTVSSETIHIDKVGPITIHQVNALAQDRTTLLRGITWWVGGRMVGTPSWDGLDGRGSILDGRSGPAKRFSFVVETDALRESVTADWSQFRESDSLDAVRRAVHGHVTKALRAAMAETHRERKKDAVAANRETLSHLPVPSRKKFGEFVDRVQENCPSLSAGDLARTAHVFALMEEASSGYALIGKLADCSPNDIDTWNTLMEEWSATAAETVLSELRRRLELIERLQRLVNADQADELHELQPLFAQGLWMFGQQYETVEFTSNRAMVTVIERLLGGGKAPSTARRPDFVALPDRSVSCFSADDYDGDGEVDGIRKILIVELKKCGLRLGTGELRQGEDYAVEVAKANGVSALTEITVYVLGSRLSDAAVEERVIGDTKRIIPMTYDVILNRAHARTFNLQRRLEERGEIFRPDEEVERIVTGLGA